MAQARSAAPVRRPRMWRYHTYLLSPRVLPGNVAQRSSCCCCSSGGGRERLGVRRWRSGRWGGLGGGGHAGVVCRGGGLMSAFVVVIMVVVRGGSGGLSPPSPAGRGGGARLAGDEGPDSSPRSTGPGAYHNGGASVAAIWLLQSKHRPVKLGAVGGFEHVRVI